MPNDIYFKHTKKYQVCTECKTPRATSNYSDDKAKVCNFCEQLVVVKPEPSEFKIMKCLRCDVEFKTIPRIRICTLCKDSNKYISDSESFGYLRG